MFVSMLSSCVSDHFCVFRITWFLSQSMQVWIPGVFSNAFKCVIQVSQLSDTMCTTCAYLCMLIKFHEKITAVLWLCISFLQSQFVRCPIVGRYLRLSHIYSCDLLKYPGIKDDPNIFNSHAKSTYYARTGIRIVALFG